MTFSRVLAVLILVAVVEASADTSAAQPVRAYTPFFAECSPAECGRRLIVLRRFTQAGQKRVLAVDPSTLETLIAPAKGLRLKRLSWLGLQAAVALEPYGRALADGEINGSSHQDAGIVHALPTGHGVVLTIDLCPSTHPLDRRLFQAVIEAFLPTERPVPLGLAVTGRWIDKHPDDFAWLRGLEARREITVTWINHSYNHRYEKGLPLSRNFLLEPGTDMRREILDTEALMIANGLRPSVFFRFPGLVSDLDLVRRVVSYGLVPIGSDAWLAKNAKGLDPTPGSIVLVHGNGNEPIGVSRFLALLKEEKSAIRSRNFLLFDLRESVRQEEDARKR